MLTEETAVFVWTVDSCGGDAVPLPAGGATETRTSGQKHSDPMESTESEYIVHKPSSLPSGRDVGLLKEKAAE